MTIIIGGSPSNGENNERVKCNKCGHVLIRGSGRCFFGPGCTISCKKCGNSYTFPSKKEWPNE